MVFNESLFDLSHVDNNCNSELTIPIISYRDFPFTSTLVLII